MKPKNPQRNQMRQKKRQKKPKMMKKTPIKIPMRTQKTPRRSLPHLMLKHRLKNKPKTFKLKELLQEFSIYAMNITTVLLKVVVLKT